MDEVLERQMREVLAREQFGVLATLYDGRLHTSTIHFAETAELELVHAIQPASLKARLATGNPRVAFQVDNRGILMESRERFLRIGFEGSLRRVGEDDVDYAYFRRAFTDKLPVGERLLQYPEIGLYVLRPSVIRVAAGATPAEDVTISYEEPAIAQPAAAWPRDDQGEAAPAIRPPDDRAGAARLGVNRPSAL